VKATTFERGIHPEEAKELTADIPIIKTSLPERVVIPLSQHTGAPSKPEVEIGDIVKRGQLIGSPQGFVSAPVHASISGRVIAIADFLHPSGRMLPSIVIESDGKDESVTFEENPNYLNLSPEEIKALIRNAGIVGLGGAAFPTSVKLSPPNEKPIDAVIINGAECEPYLTADHRLMLECSQEIVEGLKIIMKALGVNKGYIGIENNKPDAIEKMRETVSKESNIEVWSLKTKYPQGAEKMLIKSITGREVPSRGLPMDVGVVVQNVGTAFAIYETVRYGKPLIERIVTITGRGIKEPKNMLVRIGTLMSNLVEQCSGFTNEVVKIIVGGPMMGFAQWSLDVPVVKGVSGILVFTEDDYVSSEEYFPCIRCGSCIDACPMRLNPSMLSILSEKTHYEETKEYNLFDCFECGVCAYVCPSNRPIVQFIRVAKSLVKP